MKTCKEPGCKFPVFSAGFCRKHLYRVEKYKMIQDDFNNSSRKSPKTKKHSLGVKKIKPVGDKQYIINLKLSELKKQLIEENDGRCFFTGSKENITLFHIFSRSGFPQYQTKKWNCLLANLIVHQVWDQGIWKNIIKIPRIEKLMIKIKKIDNRYYNRSMTKAKENLTERQYLKFKEKIKNCV